MIIVDGGKGQLTSAKEVLRELNLENIALIGLVKDDKHKTKGIISKEGKNISASPKLLKVLTNMQEEVHNLAIGYHREKRDKDITKSKLDSIKGIGEEKKKELAKELGDILWYLAMVSKYLGMEFSKVAEMNIEKLQDRFERNKIHGSGDNR